MFVWIVFECVRVQENGIDDGYFGNGGHRHCFVELLRAKDIVLAAAAHLWHGMGGMGVGVGMDTDMDIKEDMSTDLDLEGLAVEIAEVNKKGMLHEMAMQRELIVALEAQISTQNVLLQCYECTEQTESHNGIGLEYPPWTEFEDK